ncbi:MAG: helix-turn-helix transcriptional regulator [Cellvibrionaceae bacterium]
MGRIHEQLRARRKELGLRQEDMQLGVGMSRQQYQRLEAKGNPRLDNLELVAKGLKMELMLIPKEKLIQVKTILEGRETEKPKKRPLADDPWGDLLEGDE